MESFTGENEDLDFSPGESSKARDRSNGNSRYSTGPTSPAGKSASSQNSTIHGCCSKTVILPGERQEDFDNLYDRWMSACEPDTPAATDLVEQLILQKWYLERNLRRYEEVERELAEFPFPDWTDQQHKKFQLALRYKTAAERAVSRAMHDVEAWRKSVNQQEKQLRSARKETYDGWFKLSDLHSKKELAISKAVQEARTLNVDISEPLAAMQSTQKQLRTALDRIGKQIEDSSAPPSRSKTIFQGQLHPKKLRKIPILEQSIEITVEDGVTKTQLFPSNEKLIEEGQAMDPPPEMVYRTMNFVNSIPPEYHWATTDEDRRQRGGTGIQRMMIDTWLDVIDAEKADPSGHIGPCGGNLPAPKQRADEGTDDSVPNRES